MHHPLSLYNTLSRRKEAFEPVHSPFVGVYLCGPTVYSEAHLGNARGPVVFDVLTRYLRHLGYTVRYVRNITDVGHLESDADEGEDKMEKAARAQRQEPMQIAQHYVNLYRQNMLALGCLPPDIEPQASGHITEQISMVEEIIANGFAYEVNGSVYFDVPRYNAEQDRYGKLSNRSIDDQLAGTRDTLAGQDEKRSPLDFALWKKASPEHIMRWPSPWGDGFPGWHLECSAMSRKYLGQLSDIHGGGLDLMFPHHECEIAQSQGSHTHTDESRFWVHHNLITVNGTKMSKSLGNFVLLGSMFKGPTATLTQAYSPMVVRFFLLQAHYRSPVDVSDEAMQAARKGYRKLMNGLRLLEKLSLPEGTERQPDTEKADTELRKLVADCFTGLNDDLNTARAIASLFNLLRKLNGFFANLPTLATVSEAALDEATTAYRTLVSEILGLQDEPRANAEQLLNLTLDFYQEAKATKAYDKVDQIRAALKQQGIVIKDLKTGVDWAYSED
ncbi:cysteine--tRNA ligase [Hymenobacter qilianensis]|uniref:Cysteine--tRNA ligase n=2 Tax=Hymenobacter qilianensis TaxID=1385715 RepID=A0ACB5PMI1_9BACT|nr:cysteine--tRNA ligase [Hymenobacter qilianensis]QNP53771.1 cysteine--tRNA ligase [Hymenobacter qilianensis]GGF53179.1 cysteine--tRNA ligase [Hymenobacter qilianensis]